MSTVAIPLPVKVPSRDWADEAAEHLMTVALDGLQENIAITLRDIRAQFESGRVIPAAQPEREAALMQALREARFLIEEITDREGREGMTDADFAEQVLNLAHSTNDKIRKILAASALGYALQPIPFQEADEPTAQQPQSDLVKRLMEVTTKVATLIGPKNPAVVFELGECVENCITTLEAAAAQPSREKALVKAARDVERHRNSPDDLLEAVNTLCAAVDDYEQYSEDVS